MGDVDKFAALADALNVGDDTDALERPPIEPPTVRAALQSHNLPDTNAGEVVAGGSSPPEGEQPAITSARLTATRPHDPAWTRNTATTGSVPRIRSSVNLPVRVWERVNAAKDDRWELSDLLSAAIHRDALSADAADGRHRALRGDLRVQRQYRVTADERDRLDRLAVDWRMSRSEVVAVLLDAEMDIRS